MLIARTFKSSLFQRWSAYLGQNGMTTRNLLHSVMNVQFRNYLLDAEHPIADSDVCLYVLLPVFSAFQLFAQGRHEHPQRSDIVFPTAAPNLLRDIGVCQNLTNIFGGTAACIRWVSGAALCRQDMRSLPHSRFSAHHS